MLLPLKKQMLLGAVIALSACKGASQASSEGRRGEGVAVTVESDGTRENRSDKETKVGPKEEETGARGVRWVRVRARGWILKEVLHADSPEIPKDLRTAPEAPFYELCNVERRIGPCAGVRLLGEVDPSWISVAAKLIPVVVVGAFDGTHLRILEEPRPGASAFALPREGVGTGPGLRGRALAVLLDDTVEVLRTRGVVVVTARAQVDRVELEVEVLDGPTLAFIQVRFGAQARVTAYLELLDDELEALPSSRVRGDFPLRTHSTRLATGSHHSLGYFSLRVDRVEGCVFLQSVGTSPTRVMPVLPFGYRVLDVPLRLVDFDGRIIAYEDQVVPWGGGATPLEPEDYSMRCRATRAFSGAPR